jgi:hypothetical protein
MKRKQKTPESEYIRKACVLKERKKKIKAVKENKSLEVVKAAMNEASCMILEERNKK